MVLDNCATFSFWNWDFGDWLDLIGIGALLSEVLPFSFPHPSDWMEKMG